MSFGHTIKKFIIKLNDKLDDPDAKAWDPTLTGRDARNEQWRWTELASDKNKWQVIIQRTKGWREREKEAGGRGQGCGSTGACESNKESWCTSRGWALRRSCTTASSQ